MGKVAKVNLNIQKQEFFWTYCYKVIISERSLSRETAKGVLDRTFVMNTFNGKPIFDIKETLNPAGNEARKTLFNEIMKFRKLMLLHRLIHYQDPISDIDIELEGREKELCKPLQQLFNGSYDDIKREIETALDQSGKRNTQAKNSMKGQRKTIEKIVPLTNGSGTFLKEFMLVSQQRLDTSLNATQTTGLDTRARFMDLTISAYKTAGSTNQKAN